MTELAADPDGNVDERTTLVQFLDFYRTVLARKAEGITEAQARSAVCAPSDMTLLGLIRHMADVERGWFRRGVAGEDAPPIYFGASHPDGDEDGDFHAPEDATLAEALATYWAEIAAARQAVEGVPLDAMDTRGRPFSLRWILVHMIEEYARHAGHADLLRQAIDGATGD